MLEVRRKYTIAVQLRESDHDEADLADLDEILSDADEIMQRELSQMRRRVMNEIDEKLKVYYY